jgi:hypothetical protein
LALYALNLFDLADNDLYHEYSRRSPDAVKKHGGRIVALGRLGEALDVGGPGVEPENADLHPLRRDGTRNYLWWTYERIEDLRPLFGQGSGGGR